jgi:hypothetical protein
MLLQLDKQWALDPDEINLLVQPILGFVTERKVKGPQNVCENETDLVICEAGNSETAVQSGLDLLLSQAVPRAKRKGHQRLLLIACIFFLRRPQPPFRNKVIWAFEVRARVVGCVSRYINVILVA